MGRVARRPMKCTVRIQQAVQRKAKMVKNLPAVQESQVQFLGQEDSPREGNGNPLQYSCLEKPVDRAAWRATVHGVAKNRTQLSN